MTPIKSSSAVFGNVPEDVGDVIQMDNISGITGEVAKTPPSRNADVEVTSFSDFIRSIPEKPPHTISPEATLYNYPEPECNDPSISETDFDAVFYSSPTLTDADEGIRTQKLKRNLGEMAQTFLRYFAFLVIGGQLFVYRTMIWVMIAGNELMRFISEAACQFFPDDAPYLGDRDRREIAAHLVCHAEHLHSFPPVNHHYLCCQDCMYDWHSGEYIPHDSSFHRFFALNMNAEDIGGCDGPYWERFLDDLSGGDSSLRQRVLEVIGVILTGYPVKAFFLLEGAGDTGKSQLANFIRKLLGDSACFALNDISQLGDKWTPGSLWGKLLCLCGDMPDAPLSSKAIGTIKQLTGDDLIRGEMKYQNAFTFENTAKLLFVSNYPLRLPNAEQEQALLDRLVVIPCRNPVPKEQQIEHLYEHLLDESGYIVGLAMDALLDFEARNGVFTTLPESLEWWDLVQPMDDEQDIMDFVRDCCVVEDGARCAFSEIFQAYLDYGVENPVKPKRFSQILTQRMSGVETCRTSTERGFKGIRLVGNPS